MVRAMGSEDAEPVEGSPAPTSERTEMMVLRNCRTAEEQRAFLVEARRFHDECAARISQYAGRLQDLIAQFDPLDVIAHVAFHNLLINPETYEEATHQGSQAHVEYVALLCLKGLY